MLEEEVVEEIWMGMREAPADDLGRVVVGIVMSTPGETVQSVCGATRVAPPTPNTKPTASPPIVRVSVFELTPLLVLGELPSFFFSFVSSSASSNSSSGTSKKSKQIELTL